MTDLPDKIQQLNSELDTEDVGQKRFLMNKIFHEAMEHRLRQHDKDLEPHEQIKGLRKFDGYMYKLSQDFLTSSSTFEKQKSLQKILDHLE